MNGSRTYLRDGRAPVPKNAQVSAVMSRIRAKNTQPERMMRAGLRAAGAVGYRLHYKSAPGRPDVAFVGRKVAVFVHGCFWHGCPHCQRYRPKTNRKWWTDKLAANQARDARKAAELKKAGWKMITVWECRLKKHPDREVSRVLAVLKRSTPAR